MVTHCATASSSSLIFFSREVCRSLFPTEYSTKNASRTNATKILQKHTEEAAAFNVIVTKTKVLLCIEHPKCVVQIYSITLAGVLIPAHMVLMVRETGGEQRTRRSRQDLGSKPGISLHFTRVRRV